MRNTSPIQHRANAGRSQKMQAGTVLSVTTVMHPPAGFSHHPRTIALIELEDHTKVLAPVTAKCHIGQEVKPRMRLATVSEDGLRTYAVCYEPLTQVSILEKEFPGYILALTGPSGVGKTTISRLLVSASASYAQNVPIITTRKRKEGDDGDYKYVSKQVFEELIEKGEMIAMTKIPSAGEDRWYGYRKAEFEAIWKKGMLPIVITETHLLQGLTNHFGRRSLLSFGLLPPGKSKRTMLSHLLRRLRNRGRETEEQIRARLDVAEKDLAFFHERKDLFDHVIVNEDLDGVIEVMKKHVSGLTNA